MFNLNGKNALITGASGGIGRAIAQTLHASGAMLTIRALVWNLWRNLQRV